MKISVNNEYLVESITEVVATVFSQAALSDILESFVSKIPSFFPEPENISASMECMNEKCSHINPDEKNIILSSDIIINGEKKGIIEIAVKDKNPVKKKDADLLSEYEKSLNTISIMICAFLGKRTEFIELRAKKNEMRNFCEKIDDHVFILAHDGTIIDFNSNFINCIGYSAEELRKMNIEDILPDNSLVTDKSAFLENVLKHGCSTFEIEHECNSGESIPMSITCKPLDDSGETPFLCMAKDISETKKAESELKESKNLLQKERDRLENYLDVVGSIIGIVNSDAEIIFVNKRGAEILGYPKEKIIGKNWFDDFLPESVRDITKDSFYNVMAGVLDPPPFFENLLLTKDGEERLIFWHDVPLEDENGIRIGMISSGEDITESRKTEAMLVESEKNLKAIFNNVDDQISIYRPYDKYIDVNKAVTSSTGYTKEEMLEMSPSDMVKPELKPLMEGYTERIMRENNVIFEISSVRKDGTPLPLEVNSRLIEYRGEEAIISVSRDITERKKAEERLKRYASELKKSNELKELFTDIIRHDLLTPASVIKGYTEELLNVIKDEHANMLAVKIRDNNDRLIDLLETTTKLAKLQKDEDITFERIDIVHIVKMVIDSLRSQLDDKEQEIVITGTEKCISFVNPVIEEVFVNLLSNAIKYSSRKSTIEVVFSDENNMWKVSVIDNGVGISDNDKPLLFNRFHRADKKGIKGTGLGLAIVKRIIELHGGKYGVNDNPKGHGTVFWIKVKKGVNENSPFQK